MARTDYGDEVLRGNPVEGKIPYRPSAAGIPRWGAVMSQATTKTPEPLPKTLPGVVCAQRVRCGKPGCRCADGQGHLAFYRFWREGGRLRKRYVRRADLAAVRAACEARQRERRELAEGWQQWRELASVVREASR